MHHRGAMEVKNLCLAELRSSFKICNFMHLKTFNTIKEGFINCEFAHGVKFGGCVLCLFSCERLCFVSNVQSRYGGNTKYKISKYRGDPGGTVGEHSHSLVPGTLGKDQVLKKNV